MQPRLRAITHPGQAETLVHFTGRARKDYAPEVYFQTPKGILDLICTEERLIAKPPYGSTSRTVCLSESDPAGVKALLSRGHFEGWGIVLSRVWVWEQGGGPVWYTRDEVWRRVNDQSLLRWMVRTSPHDADWLHEREWRIPTDDDYVDLADDGVVALIVSDPDWEPFRPTVVAPHPTGQQALVEISNHLATKVPRWHWDGAEIQILPPLPFTEHLLGLID
ncbi:MAG: hypothetical protein KJ938_12335 [Actinobacteria bacterium]|jgi:hypothetical protein|nr:hypothetical protein [Actinomycetota bacterium]